MVTGHTSYISDLRWSSHSGTLASCDAAGSLRLWNVDDMSQVHLFDLGEVWSHLRFIGRGIGLSPGV